MIRGTIRAGCFVSAWHVLVSLGLTDDSYFCEEVKWKTYRECTDSFAPESTGNTLEERIANFAGIALDSPEMNALAWTGLLGDEKINFERATPAQILQELLERKFFLQAQDKDLVLMLHRFEYTLNGKKYRLESTLSVTGTDQTFTAMSKTVGLPLAIASKMILGGKFQAKGVLIPLEKEFYEPILAELETFDIKFEEKNEPAK